MLWFSSRKHGSERLFTAGRKHEIMSTNLARGRDFSYFWQQSPSGKSLFATDGGGGGKRLRLEGKAG